MSNETELYNCEVLYAAFNGILKFGKFPIGHCEKISSGAEEFVRFTCFPCCLINQETASSSSDSK